MTLVYEYGLVYHLQGAAGTNIPRALENWGNDMTGCLAAYNELLGNPLYADVGIKMRQVTGWSPVEPGSLWRKD